MAKPQRIVIIGSGLAGASAARSLREKGFAGEVVLVGQEAHLPYELPAWSKGVLLGDVDDPDWVNPADFYADQKIELRGSVVVREIRLTDRVVVDVAGVALGYDRLLLATGSAAIRLPLPGADLAGVHLLRTLDDARALRGALREGVRVVVVGAGWIGCEVAAAARRHRAEVTVVAPDSTPLRRVVGDLVGGVFHDLHAEHGVTWRLRTGVEGFTDDGSGGVCGVRLTDGTELPAEVVVLGVGAAPRLALARDAGLELTFDVRGGGVVVDAALRTTHTDVCAAGDIAAHAHPRYGHQVRVEHWANAKDQGAHVAGTLLGETTPYQSSPYFFSDQYDLGLEYRGLAGPEDNLVVRGDLGKREFIAFWLREGRVRAAMNVNSWDDGDVLQALVDRQAEVSADALRGAELSSLE